MSKLPTPFNDQKRMMRLNDPARSLSQRVRAFQEIMNGPNPLTEHEIQQLIYKRPGVYDFMRAYLPWTKPQQDLKEQEKMKTTYAVKITFIDDGCTEHAIVKALNANSAGRMAVRNAGGDPEEDAFDVMPFPEGDVVSIEALFE